MFIVDWLTLILPIVGLVLITISLFAGKAINGRSPFIIRNTKYGDFNLDKSIFVFIFGTLMLCAGGYLAYDHKKLMAENEEYKIKAKANEYVEKKFKDLEDYKADLYIYLDDTIIDLIDTGKFEIRTKRNGSESTEPIAVTEFAEGGYFISSLNKLQSGQTIEIRAYNKDRSRRWKSKVQIEIPKIVVSMDSDDIYNKRRETTQMRTLIYRFVLLITILTMAICSFGQINAKYTYTRNATDWDWTVFLDCEQDVLDEIESITYYLPSNFTNRTKIVSNIGDRDFPFSMHGSANSSFAINATIKFKGGDILQKKFNIIFSNRAARVITAKNWSRKTVGRKRWDWGIYLVADRSVLNDIDCVEYTLHPTFPNPVRIVCESGSQNYPFQIQANGWGTFAIKIRVTFNDGVIQEFGHQLVFQ